MTGFFERWAMRRLVHAIPNDAEEANMKLHYVVALMIASGKYNEIFELRHFSNTLRPFVNELDINQNKCEHSRRNP